MLKLDRDGESFVFENDWDILIPVEISQTPETGLLLTVIPRFRAAGRRFLSLYADRPFSDEALGWLWDAIAPSGEAFGYLRNRFSTRRCRIFRFPAWETPREPLPGGRVLTPADAKNNRTTFDIGATLDDGRLCFGQIAGGEVVSIAATHASPDEREEGDPVEIALETVPAARRRGYAVSVLSGLTRLILARGLVPEYRCTFSNVASAKTARAAGYIEVGEACSFVMRKKGR